MAACRVTYKPDRYNLANVGYDVEEELEMRQDYTGETFFYWSFVEGPFSTLDEANGYAEQLLFIGSDRVAKEYRQ
jgi:hypothetical protein